MKAPGSSTIPTKPAEYESLDGLRDKVAAAPRYGANGKYLILQAARLVAQKESHQAVEHTKQGTCTGLSATPAAAAAGEAAQRSTSKRQLQQQQLQQQQQPQSSAAAAGLSAVQAAALLPNKLRPFVAFRPRAYTTQLQRQQVVNKLLGPYLLLLLQELQAPPHNQQKLLKECAPLAKTAGAACLAQEEGLYKAETNAHAYSARARQATASLECVPEEQLRQLKEAIQASSEAAVAAATSAPGAAAPAAAVSAPAAPSSLVAAAAGSAKAEPRVSAAAEVVHARQQQQQQQHEQQLQQEQEQEKLLEHTPPAKKQKLNQLLNSLFEDCDSVGHNKQQGGSRSSTPISNCTTAAVAAAAAPAAAHADVSAPARQHRQQLSQPDQLGNSTHHNHQPQQQQQRQQLQQSKTSEDELVVLAGGAGSSGTSQEDPAAVAPQRPITSTDQHTLDELDEEQERRELLERKRKRQEALKQAVAAAAAAATAGAAAGSSAHAHAARGVTGSYSPTASPARNDEPQSGLYSPSHEPAAAAEADLNTQVVEDEQPVVQPLDAAAPLPLGGVTHGADASAGRCEGETDAGPPAGAFDSGTVDPEGPESCMVNPDGVTATAIDAGSTATAACADGDADADMAAATAAEEAAHAALQAAIFGVEDAQDGTATAASGDRCGSVDRADLDPAAQRQAAPAAAVAAAGGDGIQGQQQEQFSSSAGDTVSPADELAEPQFVNEAIAAPEGEMDLKCEAGGLQHEAGGSQCLDSCADVEDEYKCSEAAGATEADEVEMGCQLRGDRQQPQPAGKRSRKRHRQGKAQEQLKTTGTPAPAAEGAEHWGSNVAADKGSRGSVQVQVHTFITSVLEPLLRAGVVDSKLAEKVAGKATSKVMQKHADAADAAFLVREYAAITKLVTVLLDHYQKLR